MPLITPAEVVAYTEFPEVTNRAPGKLMFDIVQAEADLFVTCGHKFEDPEYALLPDQIKIVLFKRTEFYALTSGDSSLVKGYKSESIGDYSYTMADGQVYNVNFDNLLKDYIKETAKRTSAQVRLRGV